MRLILIPTYFVNPSGEQAVQALSTVPGQAEMSRNVLFLLFKLHITCTFWQWLSISLLSERPMEVWGDGGCVCFFCVCVFGLV